MNTEFKFFYGIVGQYAEEPDTTEWWTELEVEAALERAGAELRRQREELDRLHQHLFDIRNISD
jgi:hypothetical protein